MFRYIINNINSIDNATKNNQEKQTHKNRLEMEKQSFTGGILLFLTSQKKFL